MAVVEARGVACALQLLKQTTRPNFDTNGRSELEEFGLNHTTQPALDLSQQRGFLFSPGTVPLLCRGLVLNASLQYVELRGTAVDEFGAQCFGHVLRYNQSITALGLGSNEIGAAGAGFLADGLRYNTTLQRLDVSNNTLKSRGVSELVKCGLGKLLVLDLRGNKMGSEGAAALSRALATTTSLRELRVDGNKLGDEGARQIAEAVRVNGSLEVLHAKQNGIAHNGGHALLSALCEHTSLRSLDVGQNRVFSAAVEVSRLLDTANQLRNLSLAANFVGIEHIAIIAEHIPSAKTLACVNVSGNMLRAAGGSLLLESLLQSSALRHLAMKDCEMHFDERLATLLLQLLKSCTTLESLEIAGNDLGEAVTVSLAQTLEALPNPRSLRALDLSRCNVGPRAVTLLMGITGDMQNFTSLRLAGNDVTDDTMAIICGVLRRTSGMGSVGALDLSDNRLTVGVEKLLCELVLVSPKLAGIKLSGTTLGAGLDGNILDRRAASALLRQYNAQNSTYNGDLWRRFGAPDAVDSEDAFGDPPPAVEREPDIPGLVWPLDSYDPHDRVANNIGGFAITEQQLRQRFNTLDPQGTGFLHRDLFRQLYEQVESYGVPLQDDYLDTLLGESPLMTFNEFCILMLKLVQR
eukprot:TRINITY_DN17063_c0_g1_i1.p1 TRINITY_DN17063_c0_g1~~TRINITY_DN17063_c0_g1_i1.p1  ORF type:complete len:636 (+),score=78.51 TRINITY_DN17063_c0_g1_i1:1777-3684(+)